MRPFQFRLETLLKFRRLQEEQAQIRLAEATAAFVAEQELLAALEDDLSGHVADYRRRMREPVTVSTLKMLRDYYDKLKGDIACQQERVDAAAQKRRECLAVLEEAAKARKLVEKLKEKRLAQYQAEALLEEQKLLDELGLQAFSRNS
ncbi:MAG TPA: flagellar export protein FliJ [Negativicutes bacterium]|nr:flagellar export protein FliJ [Negativicutes bacterium]